MLRGRLLRPLSSVWPITGSALSVVTRPGLTVVAADESCVLPEDVAAALGAAGSLDRTAWLRAEPRDAAPGHLLWSLATSLRVADGDWSGLVLVESGPTAQERAEPAAAGRALARCAGDGAALVVEVHPDGFAPGPMLEVLSGWATARPAVLIWYGRVPRRVRRVASTVLQSWDVAVRPDVAPRIAAGLGGSLTVEEVTRLLRVAGGRSAVVHDVVELAREGGQEAVRAALRRGRRWPGFATGLTRRLLGSCSPEDHEALSIALQLGYWHADGGSAAMAWQTVGPKPWLQPLDRGWFRLREPWASPLRRELSAARSYRRAPGPSSLSVVATTGPNPEVDDGGPSSAPTMEVSLLGSFRVEVDGRPIESWCGPRGVMLLKYLLVERHHPCSRDVLLDTFWPHAEPEQARNRLHVALSGLRRSLRAVTPVPVVEFRDGAYRINPAVNLRVDESDFRAMVDAARRADAAGDLEHAVSCYEQAASLYRGDLLADTPYEDWMMLPREGLRIVYLDILDRLTTLYLGTERFEECIASAQRILQQDACREDVHRVLMSCYARQGRVHQAHRQYELCCRSLRALLDCGPAPETRELYGAIGLRSS